MLEVITRDRYDFSVPTSKTCFNRGKPRYHLARELKYLILRPCYFLCTETSDSVVVDEEGWTYYTKSE